jgi:hypothetical protein
LSRPCFCDFSFAIAVRILALDRGSTGFSSIRRERLDLRIIDQLGRLKPFSARAVEQNFVPVGFPYGGELGGAGTMQTEIDSTGFAGSPQDLFRQGERTAEQLILIANRRVDVLPKIFHAVDLLKTSQHF